MSTGLLIAVVILSALVCPTLMWVANRRGKPAPCCPPARADKAIGDADIRELRERHAHLSVEIEARQQPTPTPGPTF